MAPQQSQQSENEPHPSSFGSSERTLTFVALTESMPLLPLIEEQILPKALFLELKPNNFHRDVTLLKSINQVIIKILKGQPLFYSLFEMSHVPQIYL